MIKKVDIEDTRQSKCRFCWRHMGPRHNESHCVVDGWEDEKVKVVSEEDCQKCNKYNSRFIEYPLTIDGIENDKIDTYRLAKIGSLCEIKPCADEYNGKSYLGIYIGDLPIAITNSFNEKTKILKNSTMTNPAIFVFELNKIIYGCESWWRIIKSVEDFKGISEEDIQNTWYVKLMK